MKRWLPLLFLLAMVTACLSGQVLSQVKQDLSCVTYSEGMNWDQVASKFGAPDITPQPEPGTDLSLNSRGYRGMTVIFYTKRQPVNEEGKIRFKEVIYKIDICQKN